MVLKEMTRRAAASSAAVAPAAAWAFSTDLGWMAIAFEIEGDEELLREVTFGHASQAKALAALRAPVCRAGEPSAAMRRLAERLQAYAAGAADDFRDVPLPLAGMSPFQRRVVEFCRRIPAGQVLTYRDLAARAGSPRGARAVGNVMRTNRFPLIVPCHRVVGAGGSLGGYSAPAGLAMKRRLLALEGVG